MSQNQRQQTDKHAAGVTTESKGEADNVVRYVQASDKVSLSVVNLAAVVDTPGYMIA